MIIWLLLENTEYDDDEIRIQTEILGAYEAENDAVHAKTLCETVKDRGVSHEVVSMPLNPKTPTWD